MARTVTALPVGLPRTAMSDRHRPGLVAFLQGSRPLNLVTIPVIYSLLVPFALLDLWVTLFQWTCFPIFGIATVRHGPYIVIDRHRLPYLNAIEKANCFYCSYATGVLGYVREVAARTEQYWCPIRHHRRLRAPHRRYRRFFKYGDAAAYRRGLAPMRRQLKPARSFGRRPQPPTER